MITQEQAEQRASQRFGPSEEDGQRNWELIEFDAGWLIRRGAALDPGRRGGAMHVIERESGKLIAFPSSVPPQRILNEYRAVVDRGQVEGQTAPS